MIKLINEILNKMVKICKPQRKFVVGALFVMISGRGKMNFRNMSRHSTFSEKTFSRNYEKPFSFAEFNQEALSLVLKPGARQIAAFDPSFIQKAGLKTYGKEFFWNGSATRAEKGLEVNLLAVVDVDYNTAYPILAGQTPPKQEESNDEEVKENRIDHYLALIKKGREHLSVDVKHLAVDGFFAKERFVSGVKEMRLEVVGKLRIDANLRHPFQGQQKGRGRPRKYGSKFAINDIAKLEFVGEIDKKVKLYTAVVYSISLKRDIRIVLLVKNDKSRALLFSTDLTLSALDIYHFYKARYQIEFLFRDAKQFTGLADCQAISQQKLDWHFNASFAALGLTKIEDRLTRGVAAGPGVFSMASWKARHFNEIFIETIFSTLGLDLTLIKSTPHFETLRNYGTIS